MNGFTLRINAGGRIAIAGGSGSGKSTLARLLVRAVKPDVGCVLLEKRPLFDYALASLRGAVCLVPQPRSLPGQYPREFAICQFTSNYPRHVSRNRNEQLDSFLRRLPRDLDTPLGLGAARSLE